MTYFNPLSLPHPKIKRTKLTKYGKAKLKKKLYYGRANRSCETCGRYVPLHGDLFTAAHLSHKRHGSNKEDTEEGCLIECYQCHMVDGHTKGIKKRTK